MQRCRHGSTRNRYFLDLLDRLKRNCAGFRVLSGVGIDSFDSERIVECLLFVCNEDVSSSLIDDFFALLIDCLRRLSD